MNFCKFGGIDFTGKSFDGVCVCNADFTGAKNVNLNPQTVKDKNLNGANFMGFDFNLADLVNVSLVGTIYNDKKEDYFESCKKNILSLF